MPRVGTIWADCSGDCALAHRFPGFWWHAAANLVYVGVAVAAACAFVAGVADMRGKRVARYDSAGDLAAFGAALDRCTGTGGCSRRSPRSRSSSRSLSRWRLPRSIAATRPSGPSSR